MRRAVGLAALALAAPTAVVLAADATAVVVGPSFVLPSTPGMAGFEPVTDLTVDGGGVVAWIGSDADGYGVHARRLGADAAPLGSDFQVNGYETGNQVYPSVAMSADGGFLVTWVRPFQELVARSFDPAGDPDGDEVVVNDYADVAVATAVPGGGFLVAWIEGYGYSFPWGETRVGARPLEGGVPTGPAFRIDSGTPYPYRRHLDLSPDGAGGVLVVWEESTQVLARPVEENGAPTAPLSRFGERFTDADVPAIALDASGEAVAVWSAERDGPEGGEYGVYSRRLASDGQPASPPWHVTTDDALQVGVQLCPMASGGFIALWGWQEGFAAAGTRGLALDSAGRPSSRRFEIVDDFGAALPRGACGAQPVMVWSDAGTILARRITVLRALFADGFESGDTTRWDPPDPRAPRPASAAP